MPNMPVISVVDDDQSVRKAISALVRSLGYAVATFASAEDFLGSDRVEDTSCLITDVQMPGLSGVELQSRLMADGRRIPIIVRSILLVVPNLQRSVVGVAESS